MTLSAQRNQLRSKNDESEAVPVVRLKHAVRLVVDKVDSVSAGTRYVGLENIESWSGRWLNSDQPADIEGGATRFHAGDVLFGKLRPYLAKSLRTDGSGVCTSELLVLRPHRLEQRYLHWVTLSPHFIEAVNATTFGAKMPRASWDNIGVLPVPVPPREGQQRIADFLDRKTAEIDALIAKKERMIALLNEKRQAVIVRLVTRGATCPSQTRDSDVAWLGSIPRQWRCVRLKFLSEFVTSGSRGWSEHCADDGAVFLRMGNLSRTSVDLRLDDIQHVRPPNTAEVRRTRALPGDLLVSVTAFLGTIGIVPEGLGDAYVNQHTALVRLRAGVVPRFIAYWLFSEVAQQQFKMSTQGGTKQGLGLDDVQNLVCILPPLQEQEAITARLDSIVGGLDQSVSGLRRSIEKLREYRQALISEAVAGRLVACETQQPSTVEQSAGGTSAVASGLIVDDFLFPSLIEPASGSGTPARAARAVSPAFKRTVLAAELISRMHDDPAFHKIKFQKTLFLAEHHLRLPSMETHYRRDAAGPHDNAAMRSIEKQLRDAKWYDMRRVNDQYVFERMEKAGGHAGYFRGFWGDYSESLDALLALLRPMKTLQAEIVATLYAAWNDFLIRGVAFDDAMVVQEVLTNWNPAKERITEDRWHKGLGWMREKGLVPTGFGTATSANGDGA